jgi:hypothetical protein
MPRQYGRRPGPGGLWLLIALAVLKAGATLVITLRRRSRAPAPAIDAKEHLRSSPSGERGWQSVTATASLCRTSIRNPVEAVKATVEQPIMSAGLRTLAAASDYDAA